MSVELLGFVAGVGLVLGGVLAFMSHERWNEIRSAYDRDKKVRRGGNALIWPGR